MNFRTATLAACIALLSSTSAFASMSIDQINSADPTKQQDTAAIVRLGALLGRAGASVGAIDGKMGPLTEAAIAAFRAMKGMGGGSQLDADTWSALSADAAPAVVSYTITDEDVAFELTPPTPESFIEMAKMERLGFHSYSEAMAEKFHMAEDLLKTLNPDADFGKAGTEIVVVATGDPLAVTVDRIEVAKASGALRGYNGNQLVFFAPAAVGSEQTPSPEGSMSVTAIAPDPNYTFDAKNIEGATEDEVAIVPPGPNGPVGSMWIDLGKPTYGIHGTPHPEKIGSMESNGCVRLTNWDANALAELVTSGTTTVEFMQ
ncbi:L,D-transpeptidase family protein [Rhizobiaceae bacterium]|nr:L,D-transpeptidase family protein [Rhizobiaceae bacterium]